MEYIAPGLGFERSDSTNFSAVSREFLAGQHKASSAGSGNRIQHTAEQQQASSSSGGDVKRELHTRDCSCQAEEGEVPSRCRLTTEVVSWITLQLH